MIFEIIIILVVVVCGVQFPRMLEIEKKEIKRLNWLWFYHLIFSVIFYFYIISIGGSDSLKYWEGAKNISGDKALLSLFENKGTQAMYALNFFFSNILDLSFYTGTILYSFIGFMGLSFFYKIAVELIHYNYRIKFFFLFPTIFYLPNLHFWSVGVGKDVLLLFCVGLFSFSLLNLKKGFGFIIFSLILAYIVRPHIALFMLLSFSMAFLMNKNIAKAKRLILFIVLIGIGAVILPSVLEYTKVEELSVESYEQFSEKQVGNLSRSHTGSSVDVSSYPLPLKIFTFLYRPTFTDINSVTALIAAFENLILLIFSINIFRRKPFKTFNNAPFVIKGLVFLLIIGTVAFSVSLGNLGIMLRMRNMFLPGMLIFICYSYSYHLESLYNKHKV